MSCRSLLTRCNVTVVSYDWDAGLSFQGLFDTIFNGNTSFSVGLGHLALRKDRMDIAHMINSFFYSDHVIVIEEKDLVSVSGGAYFAKLFRQTASTETWVGLAAIFVIYSVLITVAALPTVNLKLTISRMFETAVNLFSATIRQDGIDFRLLNGYSVYSLYTIWFLWSTIIVIAIGSILPSFFTVITTGLPFNDMQSLLRSDYTLLGRSIEFKVLNDTEDPVARHLARRMTVLPISEVQGNISVLQQYKSAHPGPTSLMTQVEFERHGDVKVRGCPITLLAVGNIMQSKAANIFTKKDFPYRNRFDQEYLVLLEHGFLKHLHTMAYMKHEKYRQHELQQCVPKVFVPKNRIGANNPILTTPIFFSKRRIYYKPPINCHCDIGETLYLLEKIAVLANFTYEIRLVPDNQYGVKIDKNGSGNWTWTGMIGEVIRNKADLTMGDIAVTRAREQVVDFTYPFMTSGLTILARRSTTEAKSIRSVADLAGQTEIKYGVVAGGSTYQFFKSHKFDPFRRMYEFMMNNSDDCFVRSYEEGVHRVHESNGRYMLIAESNLVDYAVSQNCNLTSIGREFTSTGFAIAVKTGSDLREKISRAILSLKEDHVLSELREKWWEGGQNSCRMSEGWTDSGVQVKLSMESLIGAALLLAWQFRRTSK
ncbi:putative Glutamate receptor ionotropic, kainate 5 [Hypsibius exemplaris]|uniref:Glutamate receptor ionotropic, kainate 5 n=1 Tax=Hypsibius exemplaris TaxID=2072580 RepID=A0A9X6NET2_HYPEX|nr:putative Glutamate receptor ionotropic, kainate 5 [Hypsibius exemplaris]